MAKLGLSWTCHICKRERPDTQILVYRSDVSGEHSLPTGTMFQSVRYSSDNPDCTDKARTFRFLDPTSSYIYKKED